MPSRAAAARRWPGIDEQILGVSAEPHGMEVLAHEPVNYRFLHRLRPKTAVDCQSERRAIMVILARWSARPSATPVLQPTRGHITSHAGVVMPGAVVGIVMLKPMTNC